MLYIDQFVYKNKMRTSHPLERFAFAVITIIISVAVNKPAVHLVIIMIMLWLLLFKAKIPAGVVSKLMLVPAGFLVLGVGAIAVTTDHSNTGMLLSLRVGEYFLGVTNNSLLLAGSTLLKSLSSVSALFFLILTTPLTELLYVLKLLRLPAVVIEMIMLIYRFIFVFLETAFAIYTAQSARLGFINFKRSINSFGVLFANLWGKAFLKSQALYISLLSRGYEAELKVLYPEFKFSWKNILFFTLVEIGIFTLAIV
jgi:cobalt/nickel transport system permease protein